MKKNIWILNHYANAAYISGGYRHYWFSKELRNRGYSVTVFCASFVHKGGTDVSEKGKRVLVRYKDGIRFVFIKVTPYEGNGTGRIRSMVEFASGVSFFGKRVSKKIGKPDVVLGSSVHPLACYEAIRLSRYYKCRNIVEIRDLWPESLLMMGYLRDGSWLTRMLFQGEKWLYKTCDQLVFTMEGGYQYIIDKGWQRAVPKEKVHYINNGVDLEQFDQQSAEHIVIDEDLECPSFKVIYTGTVAKANGIDRLVDAAESLEKEDILFLIYGDGDERKRLEEYCEKNKMTNIKFKGRVEKKYIPYILCHADCHADCHAINYEEETFAGKHNVMKYGGSHNKVPEYLAAGKPIVFSCKYQFGVAKKYGCGVELDKVNGPKTIAEAVMKIKKMPEEDYYKMCVNAREAARDFDIRYLVGKLERVIDVV